MRNVKKLVIIMMSLVLIMVCGTYVFAAGDDSVFTTVDSSNTPTKTTTSDGGFSNISSSNEADANNTATNNVVANGSLSTGNASNAANITNTVRSTAANNSSSNVNVTNTLAKTGLSNTNGMVALVIVVFGISAVYSLKKVNDYKKL